MKFITAVAAMAMALPLSTAEAAPLEKEERLDNRATVVRPYRAKLERMARCESTGRWFIATGNGYYGGLQFDLRTWRSVGGRGYPHQNSKLEQMYRAVRLIRARGYSPWPRCGYV